MAGQSRSRRSWQEQLIRRRGVLRTTASRPDHGRLLDLACSRETRRPSARSVRDRALLAILWRTGLSLRAVVALTGDQVLLKQDVPVELITPNATGSSDGSRVLLLDSTAQAELHRWLDVRRRILSVRRVSLTASRIFCTTCADQPGMPLALSKVQLTISRLWKHAVLRRGVRRPHTHLAQAVAQRAAVRCLRSARIPQGTETREVIEISAALDLWRKLSAR